MKNLIIILSFLIIIASCSEKEVTVDLPDYTPQLTVNCIFSPDSTWNVFLSKSVKISDKSSPSIITVGTVEIYENGVFQESLIYKKGKFLSENHRPILGNKYTIKVSVPELGSAFATENIPDPGYVKITSFKDSAYYSSSLSDWLADLKIKISDQQNEKNYYKLSLYTKDDSTGEIYPLVFSSNDPSFGFGEDELLQEITFKDDLFNGQEYTMPLKVSINDYYIEDNLNRSKNIFVRLTSLSKTYYEYSKSLERYYETNGNPFAEPVQVKSNIENGLGIFAGYSTSIDSLKY